MSRSASAAPRSPATVENRTKTGVSLPTLEKTKKFLMLMRLQKPHRDRVYHQLKPILNQSVYSYVARGKILASDIAETDPNWQRQFDPDWYDATYFSVVVETSIHHFVFLMLLQQLCYQLFC